MDLELIARIYPHFLEGALVTIAISSVALVIGLLAAATAAAAKLSRPFPVRVVGSAYSALKEAYYGEHAGSMLVVDYPQVGIHLDPFAAGAIGLGLNIGAYMAEAIRGAIVAVDRGQVEASRTLGFSARQTMQRVVVPQAARLMIRPLGVNAVALVKGSALVSTISVIELTYTAQRFISSTYKPFEVCAVAGVIYMVIVYGLSRVVDVVDARFALK